MSKLTDLVSNLQKLAADATALVTAAASVFWYRPTDAETQAFSTAHGVSVTDLAGYPGQSPDGTWQTNTAQKPIAAVTDVADEAQLLSYASFGYRSDGHRNQWDKAELTWARGISDQLSLAQSPQAACP